MDGEPLAMWSAFLLSCFRLDSPVLLVEMSVGEKTANKQYTLREKSQLVYGTKGLKTIPGSRWSW